MLERTTACLKVGAARESLKHAQRAPKSRRMLHSSFWDHGAGSLDLPPWAISMTSMPPDLPLRDDSNTPYRKGRSRRFGSQQTQQNWNISTEGGFLDFLYPPQALAWLQRANGYQLQRWEKRNVRRLAEGFVVASRGYASRAQKEARKQKLKDEQMANQNISVNDVFQFSDESPDPSAVRYDNDYANSTQNSPGFVPFGAEQSGNDASRIGDARQTRETDSQVVQSDADYPYSKQHNHRFMPFRMNRRADEDSGGQDAHRNQEADSSAGLSQNHETSGQEVDSPDSGFTFFPADLAEAIPDYGDPTKNLQTVMSLSTAGLSSRSEQLTQRAIDLYDSLGQNEKDNVGLKSKFVEWLSKQPNNMAEAKCLGLYQSIPSSHMTFETFDALLSLNLKREYHNEALRLHREALETLVKEQRISKRLLKYAIDNEQWRLAIDTAKDYHAIHGGSLIRSADPDAIAERPQLLAKALSLGKYLGHHNQWRRNTSTFTDQFCTTFFRMAISQAFLEGGQELLDFALKASQDNMAYMQITKLFEHVAKAEGGSSKIFEDVLMEVLLRDSKIGYAKVHLVVSSLYDSYSRRAGVVPPERLFSLWLSKLTKYETRLRTNENHPSSTTITDVVEQWKKYYGRVSLRGVRILLNYYAKTGSVELFHEWLTYLHSTYPDYQDQKGTLWLTIYIHARRADLDRALQAFAEVQRITTENGDRPHFRCWNVLLHAHSRADDLEGALTVLQTMIEDDEFRPSAIDFQEVLELLAKRGDVGGVEHVLRQYDLIKPGARTVDQVSALVNAHVRNGDVMNAEIVLKEALQQQQLPGGVNSSLTRCFNLIMDSFASERDIDGVMRTYRWMREEGMNRDGNTYAALMRALTIHKRGDEALAILTQVMPENGFEPTAYHYAIVIGGFMHGDLYQQAIHAYERMVRNNVRPTVSTNRAYLKAKAIVESRERERIGGADAVPAPLEDTIKALEEILEQHNGEEVAPHQTMLIPGAREGEIMLSEAHPATYFDILIYSHGRERCIEAVRELLHRYEEYTSKDGRVDKTVPIRLLGSLMSAHLRAAEYDKVEEYWQLAKSRANVVAPKVAVPLLTAQADGEKLNVDAFNLQPARSESGDDADNPKGPNQTSLLPAEGKGLVEPASSRRFILSRTLRCYVVSLRAQGRIGEAINAVVEGLSRGHDMDHWTWNAFIESLVRNSPPLCLLAYVLTERFLMPNFPGWNRRLRDHKTKADSAYGLAHIRTKHKPRSQMLPTYRTLVYLGRAILDLRRNEALGQGPSSFGLPKELHRYVGTVRQVRSQAPQTLFAVQSMPNLADSLQSRVLRREIE